MSDSIVEVKNVTKIYKRATIAMAGRAPFFLFAFCIAAAGCSSSSSPGGSNSNNNVVGIVGPSVGSSYVFSIVEKDTNGNYIQPVIYDTALVVADSITFEGRTNVTKMLDKFYDPTHNLRYSDTTYDGYDANGDFYIYDTTYPHPGWHPYPAGSKTSTTVQYDPRHFGTATVWGLTATANYTGAGSVAVGTQLIPTEDVFEVSAQNLLLITDYIELRYAPSIHFYAELIDTLFNANQAGLGLYDPIIYTHTLLSYSLK